MSKIGVLIGRFQPLHEGHKSLILEAASRCDSLIILVGSANKARSIKNPWSFKERRETIESWLETQGWMYYNPEMRLNKGHVIKIFPMNDHRYVDAQWCQDVIRTVNASDDQVTLFGHDKKGNDYLKYFPQWKYEEIRPTTGIVPVCATDIRKTMLSKNTGEISQSVRDDWAYFQKEKKTFANYPFPETLNFNCADAILMCAGHILLIKRRVPPGAGTWALPGGFKEQNETFKQCMLRELTEETNVRVPLKILEKNITKSQMFDSPDRGCGIPRNTMAFLIEIEPDSDGSLPRANGADDAMECQWVSINDVLNNYQLFDDHLDIVEVMTGTSGMLAQHNPRYK